MVRELALADSLTPHSHTPEHWHSIHWKRCFRWLRKLQVRIAQAATQGRWRVVRRLQRLLVRSPAAKLLAVQRITQNRGKKTPGVDGVTWTTPEAKLHAAQGLPHTGYHPQPLRRVYIPKPGGQKKRPLGIPTFRDRATQCLHKFALEPVAEATADRNSYGFRPERSCADAIHQVFLATSRKNSATYVLEGDISGCFDNFCQTWLEQHMPMDRHVLRGWLKAGIIEKGRFFSTTTGTPQGGVISPVLCNLALDGLEQRLRKAFPSRRSPNPKVNLIRYADDFLITGNSKTLLQEEVMPLVKGFLAERGLELSTSKTRITSISEGFDFLGQHIRKHGNKLRIKPSVKSQKALRQKVKDQLQRFRTAPQAAVIRQLNPILRGWANYHRYGMSHETFQALDYWLWRRVWVWAMRRHPQKPKRWILERYFSRQGSRKLVFCANKEVVKGQIRVLSRKECDEPTGFPTLFRMASIPFIRHVKIRGEAHPFDPRYEEYLERRWFLRHRASLSYQERQLYSRQNGRCPQCGERLEDRDTWDVHHIKYRVHGGDESLENLQLMHVNCHRQLHHPVATKSS